MSRRSASKRGLAVLPGFVSRPSRRPHRVRRSLTAIGVAVAALAVHAQAQDPEGARVIAGIEQQVRAIFEKCQQAVVKIEASDTHGRLSGTGFFIDPNGTLYTSYSVGGDSQDIIVTFGQARLPATRMVSDPRSGVAILKVEAETPFLAFGKSRDLGVASPVMTVGYPLDLPASPSFGMVGGFTIQYLGRYFATTHIRANLPVQRGQGGAPLLNLHGEVVGILISSLDQGSGSFALPIEAAEKVRRDFVRFHEIRRGWLGIEVEGIAQPVEKSTALVKEVLPDSPALKAGIAVGDIILRVGDHAIANPGDVLDASFFLTADDATSIVVSRSDQRIEFTIQPTEHPEEGSSLKRIAPAFTPGPELTLPRLEEDKLKP
ncbi:MAG: trypsin-like peptidase domain-containing protein [Chthoniobacteraceae bacterium]